MRTHGNPFQSAFRGWTIEAWTYCLSGCQSRNGSPPLSISTSFPAHKAGLNPCGTRCEAKGWSFDFHAEPLIPWCTPHFPIIWQKVYPAAWCYCKRIVSLRQGYGRPARKEVRRIGLIFAFPIGLLSAMPPCWSADSLYWNEKRLHAKTFRTKLNK